MQHEARLERRDIASWPGVAMSAKWEPVASRRERREKATGRRRGALMMREQERKRTGPGDGASHQLYPRWYTRVGMAPSAAAHRSLRAMDTSLKDTIANDLYSSRDTRLVGEIR